MCVPQALVDSGAEDNLLDVELAKQLGCTLILLERPIPAVALDGKAFAEVTHKTSSLRLVISGNHQEQISFHLISAAQTPLVLGFPWLKTHNPNIDWSAGKIRGWSAHCHSVCLRSALPSTGGATTLEEIKPPDLSKIPPEYHDLREVFDKDRAMSLPPHHPYDCAIDLLSGASLLSSQLYNLSHPEREAMEKYISESLAAGIIRPSSSPLGAGFFFVERKDTTLRPCIDFRGLNDITVKNKYPLPLISSALETLEGATIPTIPSWTSEMPTTW